ncbi:MAG: hypothetical protein GY847_07300 [Proteobacteria bacterium]|nr:hypothetical protein [Pseudomonadota bacterium]
MAEFKAFEPGIEVNGETVYSVVDGMGLFRSQALEILNNHGIRDPQPGQWYSQESWLEAFKTIAESIGRQTLYTIGRKIPENANFPPEIDDIFKALASIDFAYHMNHRRKGAVMFNPETSDMIEGIGHYWYEKLSDKSIKMVCENPYPCDFDRGIITTMAHNFKPETGDFPSVIHVDDMTCRKDGALACVYLVEW